MKAIIANSIFGCIAGLLAASLYLFVVTPSGIPTRTDTPIIKAEVGGCFRCGTKWKTGQAWHLTPYEWEQDIFPGKRYASRSCFPLCESCWLALATPAARLPYYRYLVDKWTEDDPGAGWKWLAISNSVVQGN